ncbi:MAG: methyl-accepting chemotaxis protein [Pseudomonadota bacterium]
MPSIRSFFANWKILLAASIPVVAIFVLGSQTDQWPFTLSAGVISLALAATLALTRTESTDPYKPFLDVLSHEELTLTVTAEGRIDSVSDRLARLLDTESDALAGQPLAAVAHEGGDVFSGQRIQNTAATRKRVDFSYLTDGGALLTLEARVVPLPHTDRSDPAFVLLISDITSARTNERRVQTRAQAVGRAMAVIEFTPDGIIKSVNELFENATGFSADQLVGQHHRMLMQPDDAQHPDYAAFWADLKKGEVKRGEFLRRHKSGRALWLEACYIPIRDDQENVVSVLKLAADITEINKRAVETRDILRAIRRSGGYAEFSSQGVLLKCNDQYATGLGKTKDSITDQTFEQLLSTDFASAGRAYWTEAVAGQAASGEIALRDQDDNERWYSGSLHPVRDSLGAVVKIVHFAQDVTEDKCRAKQDRLLRKSLEQVSTVGVIVADPDYNITYLNQTIESLFREHAQKMRDDIPGFNPENLLGSNIDIFHQDPSHQRGMLNAMQKSMVTDLEVGGLSLRLEVNPIFGSDGERLGTVVEWMDRTAEVIVERDVQAMVDAALSGDLTKRVTVGDDAGFLGWLGGAINELVGVSERAINETVRVLGRLSNGDLTTQMIGDFKGSFGQLKSDVNTTVHRLTEVVAGIQANTNAVKTGISEISQGNVDLSSRTEQQASSLEETASSMEEMTSTVKQNALNAEEADKLAVETRDLAERGGSVVRDAVNAMDQISESSRKITDIIGVIDEIAFQTNLLALNASVEAARAGEQGRGFAVVAREVRNLAGRSATAAKQIKDLINDSGQRVVQGSTLVNQSGETLDEIVTGIKRVTDVVSEIKVASQEQALGVEEVNRAIIQLDEFTQQNAALVEEAAAASETMGRQATELKQKMGFFTVSDALAHDNANDPASDGVDRRSANRPWSGAKADVVPSAPAKAAGQGEEWNDF